MKQNVGKAVKIAVLTVGAFVMIFPFLWMIICATNDAVDINRGTVTFGTSLFKNLQNLFAAVPKRS